MRKFVQGLISGLLLAVSLAAPVFAQAPTQSLTLTTATNYRLEYFVRGQDSPGPIALIIMHGKGFSAEGVLSRMPRWADWVASQGFRVYVPIMPWSSRWDGTHEDATSALDALVDLAAKDGKKVVVGGHSMGAMFTILYRASSPPPAVIGKFVSAPGHMLDMIPSNLDFWADLRPSIDRAKSLEAGGKGKERAKFGGRNTAGSQHITESYEMTPEVYLSWHDPKRLPSHFQALKVASLPVLWTVGANDPLVRNNASESTYSIMPGNTKSRFFVLAGKDHSSSFAASTEMLFDWMRSLVAQ